MVGISAIFVYNRQKKKVLFVYSANLPKGVVGGIITYNYLCY